MKRIIFLLVMVCAFIASSQALQRQATQADTTQATDSVTKEPKAGETVKITEWEDTPESGGKRSSVSSDYNNGFDLDSLFKGTYKHITLISLVSVILIFGFPIFVIFIAFYFQYKNKRAKYKLAEQALAAGQPIPEEFIRGNPDTDLQAKGIKNICLGIGLFIFLWALTTFAIGCVGIMIMFIGVGQVAIARSSKKQDKNDSR